MIKTTPRRCCSALWTFPSILLSAFVIAWGAEAAQFLISQGLALAILAWLQTLPEFAVEAVIAWEAGKDPTKTHLAIANFTGSLRLLVGLGWPMIYFVAAAFGWKRSAASSQSSSTTSTPSRSSACFLPIAYFIFIWWKGTLTIWDAIPLSVFYFLYLWILWKIPPIEERRRGDRGPRRRAATRARASQAATRDRAISVLFLVGGAAPLLLRASVPQLDARHRDVARRVDLRLRAVGRAVPLRVPGETERVLLGAQGVDGERRADEHGVVEHQPVERSSRR